MLYDNYSIKLSNIKKSFLEYRSPFARILDELLKSRSRVAKEYRVLNNISFQINPGDTVGIIGVNGAGKSTLLQIITGTMTQTSGNVDVNGKLSALLELGSGFNPEFTGRENVYLSCALAGLTKQESQDLIPWVQEFADIGEYFDQAVKSYSSGMYVRLAFSVAVCQKPEILIVDEALAVGDVFFQNKCLEFMKTELANSTKLVVTHDMHTVTSMCDKVLLLNNGEVAFFGEPIEGVEIYLKNYQNQSQSTDTLITSELDSSDGNKAYKSDISDDWKEISKSKIAGGLAAKILRYKTNLEEIANNQYIVKNGDCITLELVVEAKIEIKNAVFGYLINDKYGNSILGYNNLSPECKFDISISPGESILKVEFDWNDIRPGEYFITLGIGNGTDPLHHSIECWAHNIIGVKNISPNNIHFALFNHPFKSLKIR
ncbi:ABC transporter ATP-binding protein [Vibrio sp. vnigr-6D03]|uniref:ABC transporter ATP-binding protein n=1 Tax=Vibrio sp. vnigr-6D03 TaxID=2058088 RepID=UPI0015E0FD1C|nr:ABC transporter ATP-binding protein [Vibrio sp. vnigr-6D03]